MPSQQKNNFPLRETALLAIGEAITVALMCAIFALIGKFRYSVVTGGILGAVCVIVNFFVLSVTVNRAVDQVMEKRGNAEMTEEESEAFAAEHKNEISAAVKLSLFIRLGLFVAAILLAGFTSWFHIVATVIPMLAWRPLLAVAGMIKQPDAVSSDSETAAEETPEEENSDAPDGNKQSSRKKNTHG